MKVGEREREREKSSVVFIGKISNRKLSYFLFYKI